VVGYGLSGRAAARYLQAQGWDVVVVEDRPAAGQKEALRAQGLRAELAPSPRRVQALVAEADLVVPSPGVPVGHPAVVAAQRQAKGLWGEIELAWEALAARRAAQARRAGSAFGPGYGGPRAAGPQATGPQAAVAWEAGGWPRLVAITGTNGKTTVTKLVTSMLVSSGRSAVAAGNVGLPLLEAVQALELGPEATVVAEVSSFQLHYTRRFRPDVSAWLNFAPDHLDWHPDLGHYERAKARVWANQGPGDVAVFNADDPVVARQAAAVPPGAGRVSFGRGPADWRVADDGVEGPDGTRLEASELPRGLPHDLENTAAALAIALASGASREGSLEAARRTAPPPHRVEEVGHWGGVSWYDDSKATSPAAVLAGVRGFASVVLVAGGRNKGLDLSALSGAVPPVRAVVAIGEAAPELSRVFRGRVPVREAASMRAAVDAAAELARPGDAVVLSPGCASFDWYSSYQERGSDFAALVKQKLGASRAGPAAQEGQAS